MRQTVTKDQKNAKVRITDQFYGKQGMVYELTCDGVKLSLSMVGDEQGREWAAEATAKVLPAPVVATGVGRSRGEAFSVLREIWCSQREGVPFPRFDWEAIQVALTSVRAI
jgi:hypothetical protein